MSARACPAGHVLWDRSCGTCPAARAGDGPGDRSLGEGAGALVEQPGELGVAVGEPHAVGSVYTIGSNETYALAPQDDGGLATWTGIAPQAFDRFVCIDTLENAAATTATLRCVPATGARVYPDLIGAWLPSARLAELLGLLGASRVPPQGLTLGVVIERVAYRPLRNSTRLAALITAIGVDYAILMRENIGGSGSVPLVVVRCFLHELRSLHCPTPRRRMASSGRRSRPGRRASGGTRCGSRSVGRQL